MINDISQRPIIVHELVPGDPQYVVFTDASSLGKRVVRSIGTHQFSPIFLAVFLPEEVRNLLVSDKNVQGDIINSDLELTGIILRWTVLDSIIPRLKNCHMGIFWYNAPTVAWENILALKRSIT